MTRATTSGARLQLSGTHCCIQATFAVVDKLAPKRGGSRTSSTTCARLGQMRQGIGTNLRQTQSGGCHKLTLLRTCFLVSLRNRCVSRFCASLAQNTGKTRVSVPQTFSQVVLWAGFGTPWRACFGGGNLSLSWFWRFWCKVRA